MFKRSEKTIRQAGKKLVEKKSKIFIMDVKNRR